MAQDAVDAAPNVYTVLFENERVRLLQARVRPGDGAPMHAHPDTLTYILQGSKVSMSTPDGDTVEVEVQTGAVRWREAHEHAGTNLGESDFVVLFFEPK